MKYKTSPKNTLSLMISWSRVSFLSIVRALSDYFDLKLVFRVSLPCKKTENISVSVENKNREKMKNRIFFREIVGRKWRREGKVDGRLTEWRLQRERCVSKRFGFRFIAIRWLSGTAWRKWNFLEKNVHSCSNFKFRYFLLIVVNTECQPKRLKQL